MNSLSFCLLETNLISFSFLKNRFAWLTVSTLNISFSLPSGHHYFDEESLVCDGSFSLATFKIPSFDNMTIAYKCGYL